MELVYWIIGGYLTIFQLAILFMSNNFFYAIKEKSYYMAGICLAMVIMAQFFTYILLTQLLLIIIGDTK